MQDTLTLLAQHHCGGQPFVQKMKDSGNNRFGEEFWRAWDIYILPVLSEPPRIADFCCGPGVLLSRLRERYPKAHLIGVECAPWMLETLDSTHYEVIDHDLQTPNMPIADNSLDAITNIFCLHEMVQPIRLLQSIHRCLKPGGRCFITDWVRASLDSYVAEEISADIFDQKTSEEKLDNIFTHFIEHNRYTQNDIIWLLQSMNFTVLESGALQGGKFWQWIVEKK